MDRAVKESQTQVNVYILTPKQTIIKKNKQTIIQKKLNLGPAKEVKVTERYSKANNNQYYRHTQTNLSKQDKGET